MANTQQEEELGDKPSTYYVTNAPQPPRCEPPWKADRCALSFVQLDLIGKENISVLIRGSKINCSTSPWRFEDPNGGGIPEREQQSEHLICCSSIYCCEYWHFKIRVVRQGWSELFGSLCPNFLMFIACTCCYRRLLMFLYSHPDTGMRGPGQESMTLWRWMKNGEKND